jgi:hypothetical protein
MHIPPFHPASRRNLIHELDHVAVLSMNGEETSVHREFLHRGARPGSRRRIPVWGAVAVRRENLEARKALLDRLRDLIEHAELEAPSRVTWKE